MDLFEKKSNDTLDEPLALRMRPKTLDDFVGQDHVLGKDKLLRRLIETDRIMSLILYGPPGCGKTTLALIISDKTRSHFERINAASHNVADMRRIIDAAKRRQAIEGRRTILLIDEIHRFNKAQQDVLMPDVEAGNPVLIGTTTHNPFFYVNSALLSRSQVFEFKKLSDEDVVIILKRALEDKERGLGKMAIDMEEEALKHLAKVSEGDARRALSALEVGCLSTKAGKDKKIHFTVKVAEESIQKKAVVYDKDEDGHYDTISAFIKSMRGSDPDAVLYWLAKMIYAGEDPRFIARRIVICAAEDVGNADPQALVVANAALQVSEFVGMPEARIPLAQAAVYVACAPKSNAAYLGIEAALKDVEEGRLLDVPDHLKDATLDGTVFGHGKGYKYAHDFKDHYVKQQYKPSDTKYYIPTNMGYEAKIKEWLEKLKNTTPSP
ncbi:MAG: replication-associated recombination protein A [Candidatus Omnitrophica bacterium]|nr:replication-associated recombination protein A [Candidatus Omnitrophota bacterium]MCM8791414.1 replication-associated recombination protein A [Candidatus Omnitrophota bacterium]